METFVLIFFGLLISFMIYFIIGCMILMPFAGVLCKMEPMANSYNDKIDSLRQIILWPYTLLKIKRYKKG